ncbi:DUF983 domain-containing protein [Rhizobium sp. NFR03]|uniref:DUF983 domain-containing protein n=1 Tax=Rhizobium sp. NFR03 TaxID=1566263 RepID=UPI0008D0B247|nr:DUF983 domain-containing protein [Rhizobium sp. NFR03]SES10402.1 Uncharacterized conserved protein, DUF983 family [Rhizobium sp. NFR03]
METLHLGDAPVGERPVGRSIRRGLFNRCPNCGQGRMFGRFLKVKDTCSVCGEELHHHRADDFPPYIVVTIVGHLVLGGFMMTEMLVTLSNWQHLAIWVPITIAGSIALMQPVKGGVVGLQWALRMHGFGGHEDRPEDELPSQDRA